MDRVAAGILLSVSSLLEAEGITGNTEDVAEDATALDEGVLVVKKLNNASVSVEVEDIAVFRDVWVIETVGYKVVN